MASWGSQYLCMGSVQALTSGYSYALSSTYDWDSEPLLSMVHHSEVLGVRTIRDFRSLHGCIRIIQLRPTRLMWSYGDEVVELLQRIVFIFAGRFGEVTFLVMALLDTLGRYVVEFDCELCRLYFLLPRLVIDSGIVDIDYSYLYRHEMLHDSDVSPSRFFNLSIMDGNILELEGSASSTFPNPTSTIICVVTRVYKKFSTLPKAINRPFKQSALVCHHWASNPKRGQSPKRRFETASPSCSSTTAQHYQSKPPWFPLSNASLLDDDTTTTEAMAMCNNTTRAKKKTFLIATNCHPQTYDVCQTSASGFDLNVIKSDLKDFDSSSKDVFRVLVQYPRTEVEVFDYYDFVKNAPGNSVKVVMATDLLALTMLKPPWEFRVDTIVGFA
ncbi:hypothetical protein SUGI_0856080 [Cryptomeria japonica]|nr:hypothetical protein SUGI_0856080 [Cryptomeria japonica]